MNTILWAALGGGCAILAETLFRKGVDWPSHWWLFVPLSILINFFIWKLVSGGPTLIVAVAMFSLCTLTLRALVSQFVLDEPVVRGNLVAMVSLGFGIIAGHVWR